MRSHSIILVIVGFVVLFSEKAFPCGGFWDTACNVGAAASKAAEDGGKAVSKAAQDSVNSEKKAIDDTQNAINKAGDDASNATKKALDDTARAVEKAVDDSVNSTKKAISDAAKTYSKAANDLIDAGKATERFVENEIHEEGKTLSDAGKRLRQGKVVDALWGIGADQVRHTEENAAEAAQESEVLNAAVEAAATAYGGPAGAAAYGAWLAYHETRNVELALRAGALAALSSESGSIVQEMPTGTVSDVVKKAAVSGALEALLWRRQEVTPTLCATVSLKPAAWS